MCVSPRFIVHVWFERNILGRKLHEPAVDELVGGGHVV